MKLKSIAILSAFASIIVFSFIACNKQGKVETGNSEEEVFFVNAAMNELEKEGYSILKFKLPSGFQGQTADVQRAIYSRFSREELLKREEAVRIEEYLTENNLISTVINEYKDEVFQDVLLTEDAVAKHLTEAQKQELKIYKGQSNQVESTSCAVVSGYAFCLNRIKYRLYICCSQPPGAVGLSCHYARGTIPIGRC